ncbi:hypothetical protein CCC_03316 [Paramagnetospirillum magnetotacticum MS-1]|uniref:Uncharacterized protein n=1 Tax=Paramagnetospirillum magnetotacticum MS-1 TaxID=272627 RepID=A0A0C2Z040_PARME|nr:hypothetical protein [Paramagnetospirillum magnetotacticum]KIM00714.1 hypothetical protein CCC_03316 [Paramagnetospirillum magnetotacticum MS-1]
MAGRNWIGVSLAALLVAGCSSGLPPAAQVDPAPVPGVALPFNARVMIFMGDNDLKRKLSIQISRYQSEETKILDGRILAETAQTMLAKGFKQVEINDPTIRPHIVVRLTGRPGWGKQDGALKIGCGIDAWTADGQPLGNFVARWDSPMKTDYASDLGPGYAQCLKKPLDELLSSPTLARLAGLGFRDPHPRAAEEWMRALGPIPAWK